MTQRTRSRAAVALLVSLCAAPLTSRAQEASPSHASGPCGERLLREVPSRSTSAAPGSQFASDARAVSGIERDGRIESQLLAGNLPDFLRRLIPVTLRSSASVHTVVVCVLPDYLAVGSDRDYVFVPMGLDAALTIARRFGFELPTRRLVDAIYEQAAVKLHPEPLPAGAQMSSTHYFVHHAQLIDAQRSAASAVPGVLTAGHKKDLVLTNRLWQTPGRVAIYGWHRRAHAPIQPLSTVHGERYADYSHGVRLVSDTVFVDGQAKTMAEALAEPALAALISDEGPLPQLGQRLSMLLARGSAR